MPSFSLLVRGGLLWCLLLAALPGCVDPYMPDSLNTPPNYLVVDGFINTRGVSTITLSRTYNIDSGETPPQEKRATLYIEQQNGPRYPLTETSPGTYTSASLTLDIAATYRLSITTQGGLAYQSEYVGAKVTPPIDSVSWRAANQQLTLSVHSHDETQATQYYRWDCEETWEIRPTIVPQLEYVGNGRFVPIRVPFPRVCWGSERAADLKLTQTTRLSRDVVADFVLRTYPATSERLRHRYSLLVRQYAQTPAEYQYWQQLKKNTENIGSLFDPLPSQLTGNVHSLSEPAEPVLGYVGAYSVEEKRLFITRSQLPFTWNIASGYEACIPDTVEYRYVASVFGYPGNVPVYAVDGGVMGTTKDCVDCRLRGSTVKPSFWP